MQHAGQSRDARLTLPGTLDWEIVSRIEVTFKELLPIIVIVIDIDTPRGSSSSSSSTPILL